MAAEFVFFMLVFGVIGGVIAGSKGRSSFGWLLICFLTGIIGIIVIVALPSVTKVAAHPSMPPTPTPMPSNPKPHSAESEKWAVLKEVDADIKAASDRILKLHNGQLLEHKLAEKYLILSDKQYLSALVDSIEKEAASQSDPHTTGNLEAGKGTSPEGWPVEGKVGLSEFKRKPDGVYVITKGAFIGREFGSYPEMRKSYGYLD